MFWNGAGDMHAQSYCLWELTTQTTSNQILKAGEEEMEEKQLVSLYTPDVYPHPYHQESTAGDLFI